MLHILPLVPDWLKDDPEFANDKTMLSRVSSLKEKDKQEFVKTAKIIEEKILDFKSRLPDLYFGGI